MSTILTVKDHKGHQYNVPRASAVNQKALLLILGTKLTTMKAIAERRNDMTILGDNDALVGMLIALDEQTFDKVTGLITERMTPNGEQQPVGIDHFQNNMVGYFTVIAELVRGNLGDFFTWLVEDRKPVSEATSHP